jgi:hypothetical protein
MPLDELVEFPRGISLFVDAKDHLVFHVVQIKPEDIERKIKLFEAKDHLLNLQQ